MISAHFTLGPKARAEERRCRGHAMKVQMAYRCSQDDLVFGILKLRRKERHAIKGSPQNAPRRKDEYSVRAVQGKDVTFALNAPTNVLAPLMGKGPQNSVATKNKVKAVITTIKYSAPDRVMLFSFYNHPQPLWV